MNILIDILKVPAASVCDLCCETQTILKACFQKLYGERPRKIQTCIH